MQKELNMKVPRSRVMLLNLFFLTLLLVLRMPIIGMMNGIITPFLQRRNRLERMLQAGRHFLYAA